MSLILKTMSMNKSLIAKSDIGAYKSVMENKKIPAEYEDISAETSYGKQKILAYISYIPLRFKSWS